jgi:hypothetical protein
VLTGLGMVLAGRRVEWQQGGWVAWVVNVRVRTPYV